MSARSLRILTVIGILFFLIFLNSLSGSAQTLSEFINENKSSSLDDEIADKLKQTGVDEITVSGISDINFDEIFTVIFQSILETVKNPLTILPMLLSSVLLINTYDISCLNYIRPNGFMSSLFKTSILGGLTVSITLKAMFKAITALKLCNTFSASLVPIYFTILLVSSKPTGSAAFQSVMLVFCNSFSSLITYIIVPSVSMCCAMSFAIGISNSNLLLRLHKGISTLLKYGISVFMAVFSAIVSIKTSIGCSVDSVAGRLTKSVISSTVPIIGGYISDSLGALKGSITVLKSGLGIYAVVAVILIILPSLIEMLLLSFTYKITESVSNTVNSGECTFLTSLSNSIGILIVSEIAAIIMFIYSFFIVMSGV